MDIKNYFTYLPEDLFYSVASEFDENAIKSFATTSRSLYERTKNLFFTLYVFPEEHKEDFSCQNQNEMSFTGTLDLRRCAQIISSKKTLQHLTFFFPDKDASIGPIEISGSVIPVVSIKISYAWNNFFLIHLKGILFCPKIHACFPSLKKISFSPISTPQDDKATLKGVRNNVQLIQNTLNEIRDGWRLDEVTFDFQGHRLIGKDTVSWDTVVLRLGDKKNSLSRNVLNVAIDDQATPSFVQGEPQDEDVDKIQHICIAFSEVTTRNNAQNQDRTAQHYAIYEKIGEILAKFPNVQKVSITPRFFCNDTVSVEIQFLQAAIENIITNIFSQSPEKKLELNPNYLYKSVGGDISELDIALFDLKEQFSDSLEITNQNIEKSRNSLIQNRNVKKSNTEIAFLKAITDEDVIEILDKLGNSPHTVVFTPYAVEDFASLNGILGIYTSVEKLFLELPKHASELDYERIQQHYMEMVEFIEKFSGLKELHLKPNPLGNSIDVQIIPMYEAFNTILDRFPKTKIILHKDNLCQQNATLLDMGSSRFEIVVRSSEFPNKNSSQDASISSKVDTSAVANAMKDFFIVPESFSQPPPETTNSEETKFVLSYSASSTKNTSFVHTTPNASSRTHSQQPYLEIDSLKNTEEDYIELPSKLATHSTALFTLHRKEDLLLLPAMLSECPSIKKVLINLPACLADMHDEDLQKHHESIVEFIEKFPDIEELHLKPDLLGASIEIQMSYLSNILKTLLERFERTTITIHKDNIDEVSRHQNISLFSDIQCSRFKVVIGQAMNTIASSKTPSHAQKLSELDVPPNERWRL